MDMRQQGVVTVATLLLSAMVGLGGLGAVVAFNTSSSLLDDMPVPAHVTEDGTTSMQVMVPTPSVTMTPTPTPSPSPTIKAAIRVTSDAEGTRGTDDDTKDSRISSAGTDESGESHTEVSEQPSPQASDGVQASGAVHVSL